jgi:hypothetical protein
VSSTSPRIIEFVISHALQPSDISGIPQTLFLLQPIALTKHNHPVFKFIKPTQIKLSSREPGNINRPQNCYKFYIVPFVPAWDFRDKIYWHWMANSIAAMRIMNDRKCVQWTLEICNYCRLLPLHCGFTARLKLIIVDKQVGKIAASIKSLLWFVQFLCHVTLSF